MEQDNDKTDSIRASVIRIPLVIGNVASLVALGYILNTPQSCENQTVGCFSTYLNKSTTSKAMLFCLRAHLSEVLCTQI